MTMQPPLGAGRAELAAPPAPAQPSSQHIRACWKEPCERPPGNSSQPDPARCCLCSSLSQPEDLGSGHRGAGNCWESLPGVSAGNLCRHLPPGPGLPTMALDTFFSPKGVFSPWKRCCFQQGLLAEGWVGVSALGGGDWWHFWDVGRCQGPRGGWGAPPALNTPHRGGL